MAVFNCWFLFLQFPAFCKISRICVFSKFIFFSLLNVWLWEWAFNYMGEIRRNWKPGWENRNFYRFLAILGFVANSFSIVGWLPWSFSLKVSNSLFSHSVLGPLVDLLVGACDSPISPSSSEPSDSFSTSSTSAMFPLELSARLVPLGEEGVPCVRGDWFLDICFLCFLYLWA